MKFAIETILTIITGISFEKGLSNLKQLIEHMTGEAPNEFIFFAGVRVDICKQEIINQYPNLEHFSLLQNINCDNYQDVIAWAIGEVGSSLDIAPIANMPTPGEYERNGYRPNSK